MTFTFTELYAIDTRLAACFLKKNLKITFAFQSFKVGLYVYTQCHKALSFALDQTQLSIALTHF